MVLWPMVLWPLMLCLLTGRTDRLDAPIGWTDRSAGRTDRQDGPIGRTDGPIDTSSLHELFISTPEDASRAPRRLQIKPGGSRH